MRPPHQIAERATRRDDASTAARRFSRRTAAIGIERADSSCATRTARRERIGTCPISRFDALRVWRRVDNESRRFIASRDAVMPKVMP
ncbi:hypothetical protein [Pseudomonas sp. CGJS7]|uniref:hypothetical protein n=1 Tax=Pseudomonas sp. CGJS7 TaxID=3109348 RepID=UPI00300B9093